MNDGLRTLTTDCSRAGSWRIPSKSAQRWTGAATGRVLEQGVRSPLIDKRKDVDSGNATVAELQIYYLQKDASSW